MTTSDSLARGQITDPLPLTVDFDLPGPDWQLVSHVLGKSDDDTDGSIGMCST